MIEQSDVGPGLTVTIKDGPGHDATWYVVRGKSPAEVADIVGAIEATGLPAMVASVKTTITALNHLNNAFPGGVQPVDHPSAAQAGHPAPPPPAQASPPGQTTPACPHGQKQFKTGTNANTGKQWKAWMCPAAKGDPSQCPPEWIR